MTDQSLRCPCEETFRSCEGVKKLFQRCCLCSADMSEGTFSDASRLIYSYCPMLVPISSLLAYYTTKGNSSHKHNRCTGYFESSFRAYVRRYVFLRCVSLIYRPLELTLRIMELSRFSQDLHVKDPRLFRINYQYQASKMRR